MDKKIIHIDRESGIPLIGAVMFGIIDRGTNLLQIRATSVCNLKCPFCSTNANSEVHPVEYIVDLNYLVDYIKEIAKFKGDNLKAKLDSCGETLTYPKIVELVEEIKKIEEFDDISIETNGTLLTKEKIDELERVGLDRINISLNALDEDLAKKLSGTENYDVKKVLEIMDYINKSKIELFIAPIWIPKVNDEDILKIIRLAKKLKCRIGIQKYEIHRYGRKMKRVKAINYYNFYKRLGELEKEFNIKLKIGPSDFGISRKERLPLVFKKNEVVRASVKCLGWMKNQIIAVAKNRAITVVNCHDEVNKDIRVKILENKDNLYIAKKI